VLDGKLLQLKLEARTFKSSAFALATQKTYKSQLRSYLNFCLEYDCTPVPASQDTLVCYMTCLARRLLPASIPNYMNVIRLLHLESGYKNPLIDNFELSLIRRGINRQKGVPPKQKQPMSIEIMFKMFRFLDLSKSADLAFWAACCIGFFGFLRKSTLLPVNAQTEGERFLAQEDVLELEIDSFVLRVRQSKVIQFGERVHNIPFASCTLCEVCPVRAVLSHFGASVLGPKRPLFNYMHVGREVALTQLGFVVRLRSLLSKLGVRSSDYSAHSFRRGGASFAFSLGVSPLQIKLRGDWASDAYERYVFIQAGASMKVAESLSRGAVGVV
jgi:hypothetical protein